MRGLRMFITDIRNCKGREEELKRINKELANIRSKFSGVKPLNGYNKKKYVCKLLYTFLLGHKVEFGYMEAVNLLSSNAYSEKQIGYLFISVIMKENNNFMPLIMNATKEDLSSTNSVFCNLALQFIANNPSKCMADSLTEQVLSVLLASDSPNSIRQTAALTLLALLRLQPEFILDESKASRIINLISYHNLGVVTASASLVEYLAKNFTAEFEACVAHCIVRLSRIIPSAAIDFHDYTFYSVAAPWLTVKLLRILQNFPAPSDYSQKARLREFLHIILNRCQECSRSSNKFEHNNAKLAVIFEGIALIIHMEFDESLLTKAVYFLGKALNQREINLKFMSLDVMTQLSGIHTFLAKVRTQWECILNALQSETDITIKKRAVDLLYTICDETNVKPIVCELLNFLRSTEDFSEEIILKTAALAERFGTDRQWYFDSIMKMLQICGEKVYDNIWYTLVNIVADIDNLHEYAARESFEVLQEEFCQEVVVKVASYILGEFGRLIAENPQYSHVKQLNVLREKYPYCSFSTRAMLLTTFMKFYSMYPDLKNEVQSILRDKSNAQSENEEIQQRSVEYLKLSEVSFQGLLKGVFGTMPSSERQESAVVLEIEKRTKTENLKKGRSKDNRRRLNLDKYQSHYDLTLSSERLSEDGVPMVRSASQPYLQDSDVSSNFKLLMDIFRGTSISNTAPETLPMLSAPTPRVSKFPDSEAYLRLFLFNDAGVLYEDEMIKIIVECEFRKHFGRFHLKYANKTFSDFSDFTVMGNFGSIENKCSIWFKPCSRALLRVNETLEQDVQVECLREFELRPSVNIKFNSQRGNRVMKLMLPLTVNKFVEPGYMSPEAFNKRWENYEEGKQVMKDFTPKYSMIYAVTRQKLIGFRLAVIENVNADKENFCCAGILNTRENRAGFLLKLMGFPHCNRYCSYVRSSSLSLCQSISDLLFELL